MLAEPENAELHSVISGLARQLNASEFTPHMTLLGSLGPIEIELPLEKIAAAAGQLGNLRVKNVTMGESYFQSLYLLFERNEALLKLQQQYSKEGAAPFMPHVSLYYGEDRKKAWQLLEGQRLPAQVCFSGLALCSTNGPVEQWHMVKKIRF